jgi:hypothetical protein
VSCLLRLAPTACLLAVAETAPLQPSSCIVMAPPVSQHVRPRLRRLRARRALRDARPGATRLLRPFPPAGCTCPCSRTPVSCCHCVLSSGIVAQRICSPRTTKTSCCVFATPGPGQPPARPAPSCPARGAVTQCGCGHGLREPSPCATGHRLLCPFPPPQAARVRPHATPQRKKSVLLVTNEAHDAALGTPTRARWFDYS